MKRPAGLVIEGLFGHLTHRIELNRADRVTIITGPNGSGKTHALNVLKAMAELDFRALLGMPLERAQVDYDDGSRLSAQVLGPDGPLLVTGAIGRLELGEFPLDRADPRRSGVPPWLEQIGPDRWYDSRESRVLTTEVVNRRYDLTAGGELEELLAGNPWLRTFLPPAAPIMIATGRLDIRADPEDFRREPRRRPETVARIVQYAERIQAQVTEARRASLMQSQRSDREFAVRALDKARATVKESELRNRYARISVLNQELHSNGLTAETVSVAIPAGRTNPTERRILNLFLDDWQEKLAPLVPIHQKLQLLKDIVGSKLAPKRIEIGSNGELQILSHADERIAVDLLSSGEQHLLALHTMLLFSAAEGSLVLIDEPEISLHASWKHAFLADIERVAELNSLRVVLATHSTGIVNGRWDLVKEIGQVE